MRSPLWRYQFLLGLASTGLLHDRTAISIFCRREGGTPRLRRVYGKRRCARDRPQDLRDGFAPCGLAIRWQARGGPEHPACRLVRGTWRCSGTDERGPGWDRFETRCEAAQRLYVDGGITIQRFLWAGLVQRLIITRVPVLIGEGIPLFGTLPRDVRRCHVATQHFASGLVKSEYQVTS